MEFRGISEKLITELTKARQFVHGSLQHNTHQHRYLKERAKELKSHVQDDISAHLELMRNREVWLLDQVDILLQLREESVESHQQDLLILLAKLEVYLEIMQADNLEENEKITVEIQNLLSRIKAISPEADLEIGYFVNNYSLANAIKNFGCFSESVGKMVSDEEKSAPRQRSEYAEVIQKHFNAVIESPRKEWLMPRESDEEQEKFQMTSFGKFSRELRQSDSKDWLYQKSDVADDEYLGKFIIEHFQNVSAEPATKWLEPRSTSMPAHQTTHPSRVPERPETWLLTTAQHRSNNVQANNVPSSQDDEESVVSEEWVVTEEAGDENDCPMKESTDSEKWLINSSVNSVSGNEWLKSFRDSLDMRNSDWLVTLNSEPEYCQWLTPGSDSCKNCPRNESCPRETLKVFRNVWASSREEWLNTTKDW